MTEPVLYVKAEPPVAVKVTVDGQVWPGFVQAWQGQRVYVHWSQGVGSNHIGWVDARDVERV